jgi:hypothetical protein
MHCIVAIRSPSAFFCSARGLHRRSHSFGPQLVNSLQSKFSVNWDDRVSLQENWTNKSKGWQVNVEWKLGPFGAGVFATQDISAGTLLRYGRCGYNQMQFKSAEDIEAFCRDEDTGDLKPALVSYVSDYFYGFNPNDGRTGDDVAAMWYGIWVPGNGLNHSETPNTVYRLSPGGVAVGIDLVALTDVRSGDELVDDYRRHGKAPSWAANFAEKLSISMNFEGSNNFV